MSYDFHTLILRSLLTFSPLTHLHFLSTYYTWSYMATSNSTPTAIIGKRTRPLTPRRSSTSTSNSNSSTSPSPSSSVSSPETKIARSSTSPGISHSGDQGVKEQRPILCTLPPTCNRHPITLANSRELERHYATYHAHVCEYSGCGCVFPEARLLELVRALHVVFDISDLGYLMV